MSIDEIRVGSTYCPLGQLAITRRQRRRGLAHIDVDDAPSSLTFRRCRSIHTFGMKFDLKVIFLDRNSRVLEVRHVVPRRVVFGPWRTCDIVEIPLRN